jgi:hypothetical protein
MTVKSWVYTRIKLVQPTGTKPSRRMEDEAGVDTRLVATYASWEGVIAQSPHEN